ncbi:hypothetical protein DYB37_013974 [Aphanomyces astaci]|uniref:Uncharacterized protein n=2 Tax=Aphanomyces astaci TaxID=112090 RepID=A0A3R7FJE2_APHAT|nr:hypothetical protein DYB37_013974 [Aphanomyces astaci]RHZ39281.1 hypothetical protein DYB26_003867 [Aphanomyces astaci]
MQPSSFLLATFLLLLSMATGASAQTCSAEGKTVTATGFIMDNLCIDTVNLMDNPTVKTLEGPDEHSIHCLVDVKSCVDSLYTLLAPPENGSNLYTVKYQLGVAGSALAKNYAENARLLGGKKGFGATVTGVDDGTNELKCVTLSNTVVVDGKQLTLSSAPPAPSTSAASCTTAAPTTTAAPNTTAVPSGACR